MIDIHGKEAKGSKAGAKVDGTLKALGFFTM